MKKQFQSKAVPRGTRTIWRYLGALFLLFTFAIGNVWAADLEETSLVSSNFATATERAYVGNVACAITGEACPAPFTELYMYKSSNCDVAVNSATGGGSRKVSGKLQAYLNNTSKKWSWVRSSNLATTAPEVLHIKAVMLFDKTLAGSAGNTMCIAVGNGFEDGTQAYPAATNVVAGFSFNGGNTKINKYNAYGTSISGSKEFSNNTEFTLDWYINNSASKISYTDPNGTSHELAAGCFDIWVDKVLFCDAVDKATNGVSGTTMQNLYIGSNGSSTKKHEFVLSSINIYSLSAASACTAPAAPTISGETDYTEGETITLTASHDGTNHTATTTYAWYKGGTFATASVVQAAATGAAGYTFTKTAALTDDGATYWCEAANETCKSHNETGKTIAVSASSAETHSISYNSESLKGQSVSGYPTEFTEGVGKAASDFPALADVTDYHFNGWSPASIGTDVTTDVQMAATWVAAHNVTFSAGAGSGTVPAAFQKWDGAMFNLPGQGSMVAPSGKAFDGWKANGTGDKLAANAEYTMGDAAVQFVAQWKAAAQTIFDWTAATTNNIEADNTDLSNATYGTLTTGTSVAGRLLGSNTIAKNNAGYKLGNNDVCIEIAGTSDFQEGDTVIITAKGGGDGERGFAVTPSSSDNPTTNAVVTNLLNGSVNGICKVVLGEAQAGAKLRVFRHNSKTMYCKSIKVIRPAQRDIATTEITLSDLKVNNHSISSDSLAILTTAPAYTLMLGDEFVTAPEIKFNEHKVITYADELLPATKETDKVYTVTATLVDGNWQAQQEIDGNTYTVKAPKQSSVKLAYYDGATKLGEETVGIGGHPAEYAAKQSKDFATFVAWYNNSDLAEEHKIANIAELVVDEATNVYGKWTPAYASSINIEQWVLDNGVNNTPFRAELTARNYQYTSLNNLDSLNDDPSKPYRNYAYLGQKVNKTDSEISFLLKTGSTLNVRFGHIGTPLNVVIGSAEPVELTSAAYANDAPGDKKYTYTATEDVIVKFQTTGTSTCVFKQIMIDEEIQNVILPAIVTLDANGGTYTDASVKYTGTALVIGDANPADEYHVFVGWFDGDDQIDASGYVPTKNVTLQAHYANKPYTVTYLGGEGATGSMDPVQVAWGDDYAALACGFAKENHSFVKWTVAGVDAISEIAAGSAFVMPKGNVTLTAQWANDLLVARIGDDYYESLPLAVAAAIASEETSIDIQLLAKDGGVIEGSGVKIPTANKTITIDFNGMKYIAGDPAVGSTGTETQAFQLLKDNNITLKNGAIACKAGSNVKMLIQNYSNLTLKNIRLEGENLNIAASSAYTLSNNNGAVVIGNGTEVIAKEGGIAFDVCYYASYPSVSVTVQEGASIDGKIEMSMSNGKQNVEENCQLIVTGGEFENFSIDHTNIPEANVNAAISAGTFDAPVENLYCAENYVPATISAGVYSVEPKTGICLIKANVGNDSFTIDTDASLLSGTADKKNVRENSSTYAEKTGWKFQSRPAYLGITLDGDETFQAGDVVEVFVTSVANISGNNDKMRVMSANSDDKVLKESTDEMVLGINRLELPTTSTKSIYLRRSAEGGDYENFNPFVAYVAVYRIIYPTLTAITINDVVATKGEGNTFTITLPEAGTNLNALDVVPTIIRNAAHATTPEAVVGGTWAEGENTYRVMDKDGDYTDYTITITLQGEAPAPVIATQPAGVAYCAGSEPTLTVEATGDELHYAWFKEAGETDEAVGTDLASYTVEAAGTYYVIVTNHVDGKLDKSVTSENAVVTLNVAAAITKQPTNKRDIVSGASVTLSVEATNATGYQWYICDDAEKANASAISGADAANYVFNCSANAFYYCVVGNACGTDIESNVVSVKLEPEGCNVLDGTIPSAAPYIYDNGEWTLYAVTSGGKLDGTSRFDDDAEDFDGNTVNAITYGRVGMTFAKDVESLTIYATSSSSDRAISSIKVTTDDVTTGTPSYSDVTFTASAEKLGKKDSSSPYRFVLEANNMLLEAGKKYWLQFSGTVSAFKICYSEALAMPVLPTLANQELCAGAAYEAFDATITNAAACEGTVSYKWFSTADTETPVATTAEFTPTAEGTYYVVVTHAKAGHITRTAQSANLSVAHFDALTLVSHSDDVFQHMGTAATLSVVATGKNVAYVWYTCSNAAGDDAVAIDPAETEAELAIASILEGVHYYKVVISHDCDATTLSHVFKVEGWDQLEQVDVTESTVWDMNNVSASEINLASMTPSKQNVLLLLANIEGVNNNASFNSQALMFEGQRIGRTENNVKYVSGQYVQFNVTVPGMVSVTFASNGSAQRTILINGKQCSRTTNDGTYIKYDVAVEPGSVEIEDVQGYVRISKIEFKAEDNYHRTVNPSFLGTLCWTNNAVLGGATLYEFAGKDEYNKLVFDEVAENRLEAGKPYIFMPENGNTEIKLYNTDNEAALTEDQEPVNHMYGTITGKTLVPGVDDNMYYFSSNHIWAVKDFVVNIAVPAYYCYVDYPAVLADQPAPAAPAPGRRRVTMGVQGEQVVTGVENLNASEQPVKLLINGQIFILRGEKLFDATGRLVK